NALFSEIESAHGRLDVLHHQVGTPGPAGLNLDPASVELTFDLNAKSPYLATTLAWDLLRKSGKGSITLTASTSALVGSPFAPLYSLTKGGLIAFTKAMALLGAPDDIRVNVICPGSVETPM